jgi:hypothetical protein
MHVSSFFFNLKNNQATQLCIINLRNNQTTRLVRISMDEWSLPGGPKKLGALCHHPPCPCHRTTLHWPTILYCIILIFKINDAPFGMTQAQNILILTISYQVWAHFFGRARFFLDNSHVHLLKRSSKLFHGYAVWFFVELFFYWLFKWNILSHSTSWVSILIIFSIARMGAWYTLVGQSTTYPRAHAHQPRRRCILRLRGFITPCCLLRYQNQGQLQNKSCWNLCVCSIMASFFLWQYFPIDEETII